MIEEPGLEIAAETADRLAAEGPLADAMSLASPDDVATRLTARAGYPSRRMFQILTRPAEHVGLGVGTQLSLAVARLVDRIGRLS